MALQALSLRSSSPGIEFAAEHATCNMASSRSDCLISPQMKSLLGAVKKGFYPSNPFNLPLPRFHRENAFQENFRSSSHEILQLFDGSKPDLSPLRGAPFNLLLGLALGGATTWTQTSDSIGRSLRRPLFIPSFNLT